MTTNGAVENSSEHKFNPNFTQAVINATGPKATPRVRQLTAGLIQHLHDFARENELTVDEWMQGVELVRPDINLYSLDTDSPTAPR
jgi:catechol 1,2-dioxygenase